MIRTRTVARTALIGLGAVLVGAFAAAAPASAHVTVNPSDAVQGGYTRVAFRVPTESDALNTTKVEVFMPEANPIASVSTMPVPGWTAAVEKGAPATPLKAHGSDVTEVVKKVTWTANPDAVIKPGEFMEFPLSLGPLPEVDRLVFKALQTYSDNSVVRWIEEPAAAGGAEPEKPAPVLKLAKKGAAPAANTTGVTLAASSSDDSGSKTGGTALGLGIAGLVAGLAGLVLGGLAFARTRREVAEPPAA
jgi:uncharacterized protein YcnI